MPITTYTMPCRWIPSEAKKCTVCDKDGPTLKTQYRRRGKWAEVEGVNLCHDCLDNLPETPPDPTENVKWSEPGDKGATSPGA